MVRKVTPTLDDIRKRDEVRWGVPHRKAPTPARTCSETMMMLELLAFVPICLVLGVVALYFLDK